jgi:fido (protein-threonine AMPylation protein)
VSIRSEFRVRPWSPRFEWAKTTAEVAHAINRPHEDYPRRVAATEREVIRLSRVRLVPTIAEDLIRAVHGAVFFDTDLAGSWKETDVFLSPGGRTVVSKVADLMSRLEGEYRGRITALPALKDWYIDFEGIHPFPDGNGRTGGIIVAAYSHQLHTESGWLGPARTGTWPMPDRIR